MRLTRARAVLAVAAAALTAGCAADEPSGTAPTSAPQATTTSTTAAARATTPTSGRPTSAADVRLDHYAIEPGELAVAAGALTLTVTNADRVPHDVVLLRTARPIDALPTDGIRVDEDDPAVEVLGRTPRLAAGARGELAASLPAGRYVLVCTVPHHYVREAMVATLTVTG